MEAEAPVKTEGDTVAGQEDYTVVYTLIDTFAQLQAKSVTDTMTAY